MRATRDKPASPLGENAFFRNQSGKVGKGHREKQIAYNKEHGITPKSVKRAINESAYVFKSGARDKVEVGGLGLQRMELSDSELIQELTKDMLEAADNLEFERAAYLRDIISAKKKELK